MLKVAAKLSRVVVRLKTTALQNYYPFNDDALGEVKREFLMPGQRIVRFGKMSGKYFATEGNQLQVYLRTQDTWMKLLI
ncbi:hypothetical protein [Aminipila terrae]|uniref:Uncharacterized protein n=1 Tax=Aminipila terrae TaxID=2697030 RepID=A0A6P1MHD2_9FIRM|nr:hypothetical protein [Aminipila terrae]QHI73462.1 hypothetical protein Ami3637_14715 [Aminipila terrae]